MAHMLREWHVSHSLSKPGSENSSMSNSIVGKIVACIILIVLCFIVGAQAAESAKESVALIVAIVGGIFVLVMGPRCWMLIFLLPPLLNILPLPGFNRTYMVCFVVLPYWLCMWGMGYVKIRWRGLFLLDLLVLVMFSLMVAAFIKRPVTILAMGLDIDNVGGAVYAYAIAGVVCYLTYSIIPISFLQLSKVMRWSIWIMCFFAFVGAVKGLVLGGGATADEMGLAEAVQSTRFGAFSPLGKTLSLVLYASFPLSRFLCNPILLLGMLASLAGIALSGFRAAFASHVLTLAFMAFVKKELSFLILLGVLTYGGLLVLGSSGVLMSMPFGVQRTLSFLPGMKVEAAARSSGEGSTDWRVVMWEWAMDPRTKYIRDYTWGDGFGMSYAAMQRDSRAIMRGESSYGNQEGFAEKGVWHSGWIVSIHRLGVVGLVVISIFHVYMFVLVLRTACSLRGTPLFISALVYILPYTIVPLLYHLSAGTIEGLWYGFHTVALTKLLYCMAREEGLIKPFLQRRRYVPQMIAEHGDRLQQHA